MPVLLDIGREIVLSLSNQVIHLKGIVIQSFLHINFFAKCLYFLQQIQFHIFHVRPLNVFRDQSHNM